MRNKYSFTVRELISILSTYESPVISGKDDASAMQLRLGGHLMDYLVAIYGASTATDIVPFLAQYDVIVTNGGVTSFNEYVKEALDFFSARYPDSYIMNADAWHPEDLRKASKKTLDKIIDVLISTYPKYSQLLKYYADSKDKLMKAIEDSYTDSEEYHGKQRQQSENTREASTSGKSHVNDTPQNAITTGGSDYSSESFASQIEFASSDDNSTDKARQRGQNEYTRELEHKTSSERDFMIVRLDQINRNFQLIYRDWSREFGKLTWED